MDTKTAGLLRSLHLAMACSHISATAVPKTFGCFGDEHLLGDRKLHKPPVQETTLDTVQAQGPAVLKSLLPGCGGKPQGVIKLLWLTISPVVLSVQFRKTLLKQVQNLLQIHSMDVREI